MARRFRTAATVGLLVGVCVLQPTPSSGQGPEPVVHAVLFYSPTCPHCHALINDYLIPLQEQYGRRLVLLAFDVSQSWGNQVYWAALRQYEVPEENWVVPIMLVKEEILVGGVEIPARFTPILEEGLAGDGVDLPNLPALLDLLEEQGMLDHRYPGRRIVRQAAPEGEEVPEREAQAGQEEPTQRGDSAQGRPVTPAVADTQGVAAGAPTTDTLEVAGGAPARDTGAIGAEGRIDSTTAPADTITAGGADSLQAGDTVSPAPAAMPDSSGPESRPGEAPGPREPPPEDASARSSSTVPPPPEGATPSPVGERRGRPMDLAGAAEDLQSRTVMDRFNQDRTGNSLSVLVVVGMLVSVILNGFPKRGSTRAWPLWVVPTLVTLGIGVAAYLSFIELTHSEAVCGPVGDCNTVNQSEYAFLFGFLPVGVLGLLGYALILVIWAVGRLGSDTLRGRADLALWGVTLLGTIFSIYLTFLEPFLIGATCAWCLTSAVIMTLLLWYAAPLAARAWPGRTDALAGESPGARG